MRRLFICVASFVVFPAMLHAQARAGGMGHAAAAAPHFAAHVSAPSFASRAPAVSGVPTGSRWVRTPSGGLALRVPRRRVGSPVRSGVIKPGAVPEFSQDVPGLGFDFPHFAAVHPNGNFSGFRGRFRHQRFVGAFFPFFGGGGFWPLFPEDVDEGPAVDSAQPEVAQAEPQPEPYPAYAYRYPYGPRGPEPAPANSPAAAPEPSTDQYVFVRRDGTVFFAVGYVWDNGTLRYITSEGLRRSVAGSSLDLDATQQFNEQRGLNFRSPA